MSAWTVLLWAVMRCWPMLARRLSAAIGSPLSRGTGSLTQRRRSISKISSVPRRQQCGLANGMQASSSASARSLMCIAGGQERRAAGFAIEMVFANAMRNRFAVALGWLGRAERLLEGCEPCSELGRLVELRAMGALDVTHDPTAAVVLYDEVLRIGQLIRDADLVAGALAGKGTALVRLGRVSEGLRLVDESMIDAVSGLLGPFATAKVYCVTISLCQSLGDIRRAGEWTEQAMVCSSQPGMGDFPGDCQMHHAEITRLRGDWVAAESALRNSMELLERLDPSHVGEGWYEIGEIELRRGDLAAAAVAFERAAEYGKDPQPGLAMLRLAQGDFAVAAALLRVAVDNAGDGDPLVVAQLLPAVVETQLACGDVAGARLAAERLSDIALVFQTVVLQARAATSRAQVALADGADMEAFDAARVAINLWRDVGAPYETAQTQRLVAEAALRLDDRAVAMLEIDAAIAAFENLGAARDLDTAQRFRHRLGATTIGRPVRRTFMFTDIVDSTRLVAASGDEAWSRILHGHDLTIRELLAKHHGVEVKQRGGGDGFFAVFTNPADAINCAIGIQRRLAEQRDIGRPRAGDPNRRSRNRRTHERERLRRSRRPRSRANRSIRRRRQHLCQCIDGHRRGRTDRRTRARSRVQGPHRSARDPRGPMARRAHREVCCHDHTLP